MLYYIAFGSPFRALGASGGHVRGGVGHEIGALPGAGVHEVALPTARRPCVRGRLGGARGLYRGGHPERLYWLYYWRLGVFGGFKVAENGWCDVVLSGSKPFFSVDVDGFEAKYEGIAEPRWA